MYTWIARMKGPNLKACIRKGKTLCFLLSWFSPRKNHTISGHLKPLLNQEESCRENLPLKGNKIVPWNKLFVNRHKLLIQDGEQWSKTFFFTTLKWWQHFSHIIPKLYWWPSSFFYVHFKLLDLSHLQQGALGTYLVLDIGLEWWVRPCGFCLSY